MPMTSDTDASTGLAQMEGRLYHEMRSPSFWELPDVNVRRFWSVFEAHFFRATGGASDETLPIMLHVAVWCMLVSIGS
eukprot:s1151_g14.t1